MTVPILVLLIFALWTVGLLFGSVGIYRWSRILTGRASVMEWRADEVQGTEWYRRAMRAHMNCVENLPVYAAIAVSSALAGVSSPLLNACAVAILAARIAQSVIHVALEQTNRIALLRFSMFFVQVIGMVVMSVVLVIDSFG